MSATHPDRLVKPNMHIYNTSVHTKLTVHDGDLSKNTQCQMSINHIIGFRIPKATCIQFVKLACIPTRGLSNI